MAKRLKRAFTIVELVIVIAVIAILAAVLIPTFTTLIDKANESNDIALVKNLNTALVSKEATDEVNTMQDALDAAYEYGYTVDKLTPSSSGDIVWDEVNNRFALINEKKEVVFEDGAKPLTNDATKIWKIVTELAGTQDYSWYVGGLSKEAIENFKFTMGVDTGSVEANVKYENAAEQDVTIRTAGGALTVNAENATVSHYGTAQSVDVQAVDGNSYHEYGEVLGNISVKKGHFVAESGSSAAALIVTAATATDVKIDLMNESNIKNIGATNSAVSDVLSTEVIQSGANNSQIVETVLNDTANALFYGGIGTESSPYQISTIDNLLNIYTICKTYQLEHVEGFTGTIYYELVNDITITKATQISGYTVCMVYLYNSILDGNGFTIDGSDAVLTSFTYLMQNGIIRNTIFEVNDFPVALFASYSNGAAQDNGFENVTVQGRLTASGNIGAFAIYGQGSIHFTDCKNQALITGEGSNTDYNSVFVGVALVGDDGATYDYYFENCVNEGSLICGRGAMFIGNIYRGHANLHVTNCSNDGVIRSAVGVQDESNQYVAIGGPQRVTLFLEDVQQESLDIGFSNNFFYGPNDGSFTVSKNDDNTLTITMPSYDNIAYFVIGVGLYVNIDGEDGGTNRFYVQETINIDEISENAQSFTSTIKDIGFSNGKNMTDTGVVVGDEDISIVKDADGKEYYLFNKEGYLLSADKVNRGSKMVYVAAFDKDGNLIVSAILN